MPQLIAPTPPPNRRVERESVELLARFRHDLTNVTVVLKDLTRFGARIEGVEALAADTPVTLGLPGCRPVMAFVAWSNYHGTGLEFAQPLPIVSYRELVASHRLGRAGVISGLSSPTAH